MGGINASFANTNGTVLTSAFRVDSTGNFPFGPALAYSPEADVFLVVWTVGGGQVRGRLVRYGVNALGSADFALSGTGVASGAWAPAVAYSPTSQEFLVAFSKGGTGFARVSTAGAVIGQPVLASVPVASGYHWTESPAVAWNPTNNEFLLTYAQELSPGWQIRAHRISAGQLVGGMATVHSAGSTKMPDVQLQHPGRKVSRDLVSGQSLRHLWPDAECRRHGCDDAAADAAVKLRLLRRQLAGVQLVQPQVCRGDDHAAVCCGRRHARHNRRRAVSTAGVPSTAMRYVEADSGNRFFPEIAGSSTNNRFLVSFNKSHATFYGQMLATGGSVDPGGGGIPSPLSVTSFTPNKSFPITLGTSVTFTAGVSGGTGPHTYRFVTYNASTGWAITQDYSALNTFTYFPNVGTNAVQVWVRNAGSAADYDAYTSSGFFTVSGTTTPVVTSFTANKTFPQPINSLDHLHGHLVGRRESAVPFVTYNASTGWAITQDYSALNTFSYYPGSGTNAVQVWVRNAGSSADYQAYRSAGTSRYPGSPGAGHQLHRQQDVAAAGQHVADLQRDGNGRSNTLQDRFVTYNGSVGWRITQDYSSLNTFTYFPGVGTNAVQVWVRSAGSLADYDAYRTSGLFTITSLNPPTGVTLTPLQAFPAGYNTLVSFTASAVGGTNVQYRFVTYNQARAGDHAGLRRDQHLRLLSGGRHECGAGLGAQRGVHCGLRGVGAVRATSTSTPTSRRARRLDSTLPPAAPALRKGYH